MGESIIRYYLFLLQGFFRRTLKKQLTYRPCQMGSQCKIDQNSRNKCQYCRYQRCLNAGMSQDGMHICSSPSATCSLFQMFMCNTFRKHTYIHTTLHSHILTLALHTHLSHNTQYTMHKHKITCMIQLRTSYGQERIKHLKTAMTFMIIGHWAFINTHLIVICPCTDAKLPKRINIYLWSNILRNLRDRE